MRVRGNTCVRAHPLGAATNFYACVEKKDKSAHAHVGVHETLDRIYASFTPTCVRVMRAQKYLSSNLGATVLF